MIESWIAATIEKYKFQFKPLGIKEDDGEVVVAMDVSGTFDGSMLLSIITSAFKTIKSYPS